MENKNKLYKVFPGVQKPLEFKGLKGRYIQWAGSILAGSFILLMVLKFLMGWIFSALITVIISAALWLYMLSKAKKGTYTKNVTLGVVVIDPKFKKLI